MVLLRGRNGAASSAESGPLPPLRPTAGRGPQAGRLDAGWERASPCIAVYLFMREVQASSRGCDKL